MSVKYFVISVLLILSVNTSARGINYDYLESRYNQSQVNGSELDYLSIVASKSFNSGLFLEGEYLEYSSQVTGDFTGRSKLGFVGLATGDGEEFSLYGKVGYLDSLVSGPGVRSDATGYQLLVGARTLLLESLEVGTSVGVQSLSDAGVKTNDGIGNVHAQYFVSNRLAFKLTLQRSVLNVKGQSTNQNLAIVGLQYSF